MTSPAASFKTAERKADLPFSYRCSAWVRALICVATGIAAGVCGTLVHRLGAQYNLPVGLILALLIIAISAWSSRARSGVVGLALHLIASSGVIVVASFTAASGDILLPMGFYSSDMPFLSQNAFWFWFIGMIAIQFVMVFLPQHLFAIPASRRRSVAHRDAASVDTVSREVTQP
ncbi:alcohol dehydrogenase [Bifidobacterium sp. ESL0800]|uniref:alcohol dehydrogenase n=1 Tax=Bifidobacterium sp. ESL0800 TaxID=2983236 RepID=UPI0023F91039|nr:alcohol dehydrogenase [Bifidobacterium sp. ESL0800]WEV76422.1 alcohol dehydrogenase [Bifidobacterium sp. ESL0800]